MKPKEFRALRESIPMTQKHLAQAARTNEQSIWRWETGRRKIWGPLQVLLETWAAHPEIVPPKEEKTPLA